ncbi:MAG: hypothetical protein Q7L07_18650 [Pseudohongiella sp.]|nr:hypothetical protein [Pseudohongiella sp.]MDP1755861.1 hypothetical protein [Pseudohongiella sp.]
MIKINNEVSDQVWNAMIIMALKYQRRIGRYHNIRYDRKHVYLVLTICEIAHILVDQRAIHTWPAGSRRLGDIEKGVIREFTKLHGKTHLDT